MNWNVTISQALPWRSVLEISYVANKSQNEWINGSNGNLNDLNNIPRQLLPSDPLKAERSCQALPPKRMLTSGLTLPTATLATPGSH